MRSLDTFKKKVALDTAIEKVVYVLPYLTSDDIQRAGRLRTSLYEEYNYVLVYPEGIDKVRIIAHN